MQNKAAIFLGLLALLGAISYRPIYDFFYFSGLFIETPKAYSGDECKKIEENVVEACEDIEIHHESGYAFMACGNSKLRQTHWFPPGGVFKNKSIQYREQVFAYDINSEALTPLVFKNYPEEEDVVLHGLGLYQEPTEHNDLYMFLINHKRSGSVVEIFKHKIGSRDLHYLETVKDDLINTPNSVVPISKNEFYVTNDHYYRSGFMRQFEVFTFRPWSNVVFYSGVDKKAEVVADGLKYANGLDSNWDNSRIYVATSLDGELYIYERKHDNKLKLVDTIEINRAMDNIDVDDVTGEIYVALFPKPLGLIEFFDDSKTLVPSMIMKISNNTKEDKYHGVKYSKQILFQDDGSFFDSVTVSAVDRKRNVLLLGSVEDEGFVRCKLSELED